MILDLDATTRTELASMCYARWSDAYANLKHVRGMTWESNKQVCPKGDWPLFHATMLESAKRELMLAEILRDAICPFSPLVKGE